MDSIQLMVYINNTVCVIALITCFFHALHSRLHTTNLTKAVLYTLGLGFYSSVITERSELLIPGHEYVMIINTIVAVALIVIFAVEYWRTGCWMQTRREVIALWRGVTHATSSKK